MVYLSPQLLDRVALRSLVQVDQRAAAFFGDAAHGSVDGVAAVAPTGAENIAHQAVGVHAHQHRLVAGMLDVALDQRNVRVAVDLRLIGDHAKFAVSGRHSASASAAHVALVRHAVADELRHGQHLEIMLAAEVGQLRHPRHGAVVVHDLADHAGRNQSRQAREIDGRFGLSCAHQHAAFAGAQREDMSGTREIVGPGAGIDGDLDGLRAIIGRDAGSDAVSCVDRLGECGAEVRGVLRRHGTEPQVIQALFGHRQANQSAPVPGHEVDGLRGDHLGGHGEIAFVFAVFVVDDHDHAPRADFLQRGFNIAE